MLLRPIDVGIISRDLQTLMNGHDGSNVVMTWTTGTQDEVYKDIEDGTQNTRTFRGHVNRIFREADIEKRKWSDVVPGDAVLLIPKDVNLANLVNVKFQIEGLGQYTLIETPAPVVSMYAPLVVSAEQFVQYAFIRRV